MAQTTVNRRSGLGLETHLRLESRSLLRWGVGVVVVY
jgi:hypothetical protein